MSKQIILFAVVLLIVPVVKCKNLPPCNFIQRGQPEFNDTKVAEFATTLANQTERMQKKIAESALKYIRLQSGSDNFTSFFDSWNGTYPVSWMQGYLYWDLQDHQATSITRNEYLDRVKNLYVSFNRIWHYLLSIKEGGSEVVDDATREAQKIRTNVTNVLSEVRCAMYLFLGKVSIKPVLEEFSESGKFVLENEEIQNGLLYVYLTKAVEQLINYSRLFADSYQY